MNLQDDTIQLLVDLVEKEQRRLDQFQPDSQDYARRFHALMDRFADDQPLRKELLGLADLPGGGLGRLVERAALRTEIIGIIIVGLTALIASHFAHNATRPFISLPV